MPHCVIYSLHKLPEDPLYYENVSGLHSAWHMISIQ